MSNDTDPEPLTLDRMRADIAALLDAAPEDVGNDDNLMDLGLDSLRAMTLIMSWSGRGTDYEFGDFAAAEPTLAGWWDVVRQAQQDAG